MEFTTKTGKKVLIGLAPWPDAKKLKAAIEREVANAGIKIGADTDPGAFLSAALLVDSSEAVDSALVACLARCTYDGNRITEQTFESADARKDYYEIAHACMKENIGPLVEGLLSALPERLRAILKGHASSVH